MDYYGDYKMSKPHLQQEAKKLYLMHKTLDEIAELLPVSKTTLCEWSNRFHWKEQRDTLDASLETLSFELREKLATNIKKLQIQPDGTYPVNWDDMSKAASAIEKFGGVDDPLSVAVEGMDRFSRWTQAQEWPEEKKNHVHEAINAYLDQIGEEAY